MFLLNILIFSNNIFYKTVINSLMKKISLRGIVISILFNLYKINYIFILTSFSDVMSVKTILLF